MPAHALPVRAPQPLAAHARSRDAPQVVEILRAGEPPSVRVRAAVAVAAVVLQVVPVAELGRAEALVVLFAARAAERGIDALILGVVVDFGEWGR